MDSFATKSPRILSFLLAAGTLILGAIFLLGDTCTVETVMMPLVSPDKAEAIDLYSKTCHPRYSSAPDKIKGYQVVVLRPITEPPPDRNQYREEDVVFEIEKGNERTQFSFGSPLQSVYFENLPQAERENTLAIGCQLSCPASRIRKKLHSWRGHTIHYILTESESSSATTE